MTELNFAKPGEVQLMGKIKLWSMFASALFAAGAATVYAKPSSQTTQSRASRVRTGTPQELVGTWRLISFEDVEDGKVIHRFGDKPIGLFVYTADGHVIIHIANPANPACLAPGKKSGAGKKDDIALPACTPEQAQALLDGTVAYWGTYSVEIKAGVVTHHVLSDLANGYAGTAQPRPFRLDGDRLVIGDGKTWTRVLERVMR